MEKQDPEILKQEEKREIRRAMKLRRREADQAASEGGIPTM